MLLMQLHTKTINLELIRCVESELEPRPTAIVTWSNGDKTTFRDDDAKALLAAIAINSDLPLDEGISMSELSEFIHGKRG